MIRVLLVDDHSLVREGCRRVLDKAGGIEVVGQAGSAEEALAMIRADPPDVVLMDINLPGMSGLQATERLAATHPQVRVIVLTVFDQLPYPQRLLEAGAVGYLTKEAPATELVEAVRKVSRGEHFLSPEIASRMALNKFRSGGKSSPLELLTRRELEVAVRLARGDTNKAIARALHVSEKTISTHKTNILGKLEVTSAVALANLLAHHGLIESLGSGIAPA